MAVPDGLTYLSPAPLYHSAPQAAVNLAIRHGGTVVIMEKFSIPSSTCAWSNATG